MPNYVERLATEVMESDAPLVTNRLLEAVNYASPVHNEHPPTRRWRRDEMARCYLAAVLAYARVEERELSTADALRAASSLACRFTAALSGETT